MKKKYVIEFTHASGEKEIVELVTDNIEWSVQQWARNRHIVKHEVIEENVDNSKQMLFG